MWRTSVRTTTATTVTDTITSTQRPGKLLAAGSSSSTSACVTPTQATIAIAPRRPKKNVLHSTGHTYSTAPSPAPGVAASASPISTTPIGPSSDSAARGSRGPNSTSRSTIAG